MIDMGLSFVPIRKLIVNYDGGIEATIRILSDLRDYCGQILDEADKSWEYSSSFKSLINLLDTDVKTLRNSGKVVSLATIIMANTDKMDLTQDRLDKFYDLCDEADVELGETLGYE